MDTELISQTVAADEPDPDPPNNSHNPAAHLAKYQFQPGQSGNVKGRPPGDTTAQLAKLQRQYVKRASKIMGTNLVAPLRDMGATLTPEDQENVVRGRLLLNTVLGKDAGVMSATKLGSDKRVNMFAPETLNQNLVIMPAELPGRSRNTAPQAVTQSDTAQLADK